jgi:cleavage stimulation factor subunit 3
MITQAQNTQEESQRMTAVRKVYQKAILNPTHHIEQLWKDYENFENSVSRQLVTFWFWIVIVICTSWY